METTIYRGTSQGVDNGTRYYTECLAVAKTYVGWRKGSESGELITLTINPENVFDANSKEAFSIAQSLAKYQGWEPNYVKKFASYYENKPNNAFTGLIIALEIANREAGVISTHEQDEDTIINLLSKSGYDFVKQTEIGGAPYPDGTFRQARKKHTTWITL